MVRKLPVLLLVSSVVAGCQRTDHAVPVEPVASPAPTPLQPAVTAPAAVTPSCLVPLAESPAPTAKPATHCPVDPAVTVPLTRGTVKFLGGTQSSIVVELALAPEDQQHGLMYRTELATDSGMLFSWSNETLHTFWMHNTCIPLDMLFITADGTIVGILEQVPVLNDEPRTIPCPAAHVLEVNAGYCRRHGILPGQRVRIKTT